MKLGIGWGSGVAVPEIVSWVQTYAAGVGWRGRFGTELWDDPKGLEHALKTVPLTWTYVLEDGKLAYGVTGWQFLATCRANQIPVLIVLDPMDPGNGDLDGTGYHRQPLDARISFPKFKRRDLKALAEELLECIAEDFEGLQVSGLQWGNEVEYLPYVGNEKAWKAAYKKYFRGLEVLGEVLAKSAPGVPVVVGGDSGTETFEITTTNGQTQERTTLAWYCGRRSQKKWSADLAPLALDFHADFLVKKMPITEEEVEELENEVTAAGKTLGRFGLPVYLTECGAYRHFDRIGAAASNAGIEALWGVACRWLVPSWGVSESNKNDTRAFGCFGRPEWDNEPTRQSFERLTQTEGLVVDRDA